MQIGDLVKSLCPVEDCMFCGRSKIGKIINIYYDAYDILFKDTGLTLILNSKEIVPLKNKYKDDMIAGLADTGTAR